MGTARVIVKRRKFIIGYHEQDQWTWLIASAFFFGKIGAGLFFVSLLLGEGNRMGILVGTLIVLIGKGGAHLLYLGRPERFWRAMLRPATSWVSRGLIAMGVLIGFGIIFYFVAPPYSQPIQALRAIALLVALFVMIYDGFLMNSSPAIQFWNNALLPVLCFFYALLGGSTLTFLLASLSTSGVVRMEQIESLETSILLFNLALLIIYLVSASGASSGARVSVEELLSGRFRMPFLLGVVVVGIGVAIGADLLFAADRNVAYLWLLLAGDLVGHFLVFYLFLRAGVFSPQRLRGPERYA
ncbi:MAG: polysulfide reductase NrfD [Chloroflexi bacterium]|nr:polysulfide reductase NrfD [Chloroflexota bacterium]